MRSDRPLWDGVAAILYAVSAALYLQFVVSAPHRPLFDDGPGLIEPFGPTFPRAPGALAQALWSPYGEHSIFVPRAIVAIDTLLFGCLSFPRLITYGNLFFICFELVLAAAFARSRGGHEAFRAFLPVHLVLTSPAAFSLTLWAIVSIQYSLVLLCGALMAAIAVWTGGRPKHIAGLAACTVIAAGNSVMGIAANGAAAMIFAIRRRFTAAAATVTVAMVVTLLISTATWSGRFESEGFPVTVLLRRFAGLAGLGLVNAAQHPAEIVGCLVLAPIAFRVGRLRSPGDFGPALGLAMAAMLAAVAAGRTNLDDETFYLQGRYQALSLAFVAASYLTVLECFTDQAFARTFVGLATGAAVLFSVWCYRHYPAHIAALFEEAERVFPPKPMPGFVCGAAGDQIGEKR